MKQVFPFITSLLVTVLFSTPFQAQSSSQVTKTTEKTTAAAYVPSEGDERRNQTEGSTTQLNASSPNSEDSVKPVSSESVEAQKLYTSAVALYEAGKLNEAIEAFKQAVKLRPEDAQTHYSLGMAYSQSRAYQEASDSFKRAVKFKPDWPEANFRVGMMAYVLGRRSQAVDAYNKLIKLNSPLANTLYRIINEGKPSNNSATARELPKTTPPAENAASSPAPKTSNSTPAESTATKKSEPVKTSSGPAENSRTTGNAPTVSTTAAPTPANAASDQPPTGLYRVAVGDVLDIRLLNSTIPRSTLYTVVDGGLIDFPIAGGPLSVGGLTTDEIQNRITTELKRRAVEGNSVVVVGVRQFASHAVIVTGLVANPGTRFIRREAVPLYVIMAEAQPRSDAGRVTIMSASGEKRTVDLVDASAQSALVRSGDVVTVSARPQEFYYIAGRVNYPGQKPFQTGITLLQAILAAGGTTRPSDNDIDVSREGTDGRLTTTRFKLKEIKAGKLQDPRLQAGDRIEVVH